MGYLIAFMGGCILGVGTMCLVQIRRYNRMEEDS